MEIERARLTKRLAGILEGEGKVTEAAETLQEVAVVSACSFPLPCRVHLKLADGNFMADGNFNSHACTCPCTGDVWGNGQGREDLLHPGASAALPAAKRLRQVAGYPLAQQ